MKASAQSSLDLSLFWRGDRLAFRGLDGPGEVWVGDCPGSLGRIPCEGPGFVVARRAAQGAVACVPSSTMGTIRRSTGEIALIEGPAEISLAEGEQLSLVFGDFTLEISASVIEPPAAPRVGLRARSAWGHIAAAALAHLVVLGLAAQAAAARDADDDAGEQSEVVRTLLISAEERMLARPPPGEGGSGGPEHGDVEARADQGQAGGGARAAGQAGKMGERESRAAQQARFAVLEQDRKDPTRALSREEALSEAASFGMIGVARSDAERHPSPASPWAGVAEALGADSLAARGAMWGDWQGSYRGDHGLTLSGIGEGGGGKGEGIGLGTVGVLGHGPTSSFYGSSLGRRGRGGPTGTLRLGAIQIAKSWADWKGGYEHVRYGEDPSLRTARYLRQIHGRIRLCYENGLRRDPKLAGQVVVRFVIDRDGAVTNLSDGGSTLPDREVVQCIVQAFRGLWLPAQEQGIITVSYPIMLSPA